MSLSSGEFARRVVIVGTIAAVAILLWRLIEVVLLLFAGIILAVAFVALSRRLMRYVRLGRRWALAVVVCLVTVAILGLGALMGSRLAAQFGQLGHTLTTESTQLRQTKLGVLLQSSSQSVPVQSVSHFLTEAATGFAGAVTGAILIVFVGVFIAADPDWYMRGVLRLVPGAARGRTRLVLEALGTAISRWRREVTVCPMWSAEGGRTPVRNARVTTGKPRSRVV